MKKLLFVGILVLAMSGLALAQDFPKYEVFGGYSYMRSDLGNTTSWMGSNYNSDSVPGVTNGHGFEASFTYNLNKWLGIKGDFSTHFSTTDLNAKDSYVYSYPSDYYYGYSQTNTQKGSAETRQYTYLFGPEFSLRKYEKFRPFAHVLVGFTTVDVHKLNVIEDHLYEQQYPDGSTYYSEHWTYQTTGTVKGTSFALALGGGVDIKVSKRISLRIPQVDYIIPTLQNLTVDVTEKETDYNSDDTIYYTRSDKYNMKVPTSRFHNVRVSTGLVFTF
jgi:opacity protein-like surface antigen